MNEYLLSLYNWISSKDSNFASRATPKKFVEKMENDPSYNASIHKWISNKDGMFSQKSPLNVFQEKTLKKKDLPVVSSSQKDVTEPVSTDAGSLVSPEKIKGISDYFERKDITKEKLDQDLNLQAAINSGVITDQDLINAGLKDPDTVSSINVLDERSKQESINKISSLRQKTKEEIDLAINQQKLNIPYKYKKLASNDSFVDDVYGEAELALLQIDPEDFDGFLEEKGYKKDFIKKQNEGLFKKTYGSAQDPKLGYELEKMRLLNLYVAEQLNRDIDYQKLEKQKETGVDPDFTEDKFNFTPSKSNVNTKLLTSYIEKEMPYLTKKLKETEAENIKLYRDYKDGGIGAGTFMGTVVNEGWKGIESRIQGLSASFYGTLGKTGIDYFKNMAEATRMQMDQEKLLSVDNLSYVSISGKKVNVDGTNYLVDENGNIYDVDIKIKVDQFLYPDEGKNIIKKAYNEGIESRSFSTRGTVFQSANVIGDMTVQIALTGATGKALAAGAGYKGSIGALHKAKDILNKVPLSRSMSSAILAQSTLGASSGYNQTYQLAKDAGLNEDEARELASYGSVQMAALYAITAPISPQTKATEAIFRNLKSTTIKSAIEGYKKMGKKGFMEVFEKAGKKVVDLTGEGLKEVGQENVQQTGEALIVNRNINEEAGQKIAEDTITLDSFINTSILSFTAGMFMPGAGAAINTANRKARDIMGLKGIDRIKSLDYLARNEDKLKELLDDQVTKGVYTVQEKNELLSEVNTYKEGIGKLPTDLDPELALEILDDIAEISKLENRKVKDNLFDEKIDNQIKEIRDNIKTKIDSFEEQEVKVKPETKVDPLAINDKDPVKKESYSFTKERIEGQPDENFTVDVTTSKDGTRTFRYKNEDGEIYTTDSVSKDNTLTNQEYIEATETVESGTINVTETVEGFENIANPKSVARRKKELEDTQPISPEQEVEQTYVLPETKKEWKKDFEIIDNRDGSTDKDGGKWMIANKKTGTIVVDTDTKKDAQGIIDNMDLNPGISGVGDPLIEKQQVEVEKRNPLTEKVKIDEQAEKARKSLGKLMPNVTINTYFNENEYKRATGRSNAGLFNLTTNTISINLTKANLKTVGHEVFHAVLFNLLKSDAKIQKISKDMIKAMDNTQDPELIKILKTAVKEANYDVVVQNEEMMSELFGAMAGEYKNLKPNTQNIIKKFLDKLAKALGLKPFTDTEIIDVLNTLAGRVGKGEVITEDDVAIIKSVDNGTMFDNTYLKTDGKVVQTDSKRSAVDIDVADLLDTKDIAGKPLEVVYYDNYTSSIYKLKNRISGKEIQVQGEGGPGYSYRKIIKDNKIIGAFTTVTKGLNLIEGIKSRNKVAGEKSVLGIALQNKESGHLGNKTTARDFYHPGVNKGVIAQAIRDGVMTEENALTMLKNAVDAYSQTSKGKAATSSLGFAKDDFNSLEQFYDLINNVTFEKRGTFNKNIIPSKPDLKISKSTRPHIKEWLSYGLPTLQEYNEATAEPYTKNAKAHDVVKYLDPDLNSIGIDSSVEVSEAEKERAKKAGINIIKIDDNVSHTSYPVVLFGKNIGVPKFFHSLVDMAPEWDMSNVFYKAGRRKADAEPVRIPGDLKSERKFVKEQRIPKPKGPSVTYIRKKSTQAILDKKKKKTFKYYKQKVREKILDRQTRIKGLLKGIGDKNSLKATNLLITKAGAGGNANLRVKEAKKKIFNKLSEEDKNNLDEIIYAKRIVAINKNRAAQKKPKYKGIQGYNEKNAEFDLQQKKQELGEEKFNDLSKRSDEYFKVFGESLKRMRDAKLISEDVYNQLKDTEYSPIKTIKYLIPEDYDKGEIDRMSIVTGLSADAIKNLSDENVNEIIMDSEWLLTTNVAMIEARVFENRMLNAFDKAVEGATTEQKKGFEDAILDNPVISKSKEGKLTYKYDKVKTPPGFVKVRFVKDGQAKYIVVKNVYAKQLLDIKAKPGMLEKGVVNLTGVNILRFLATSGNPLFIVGNTAIDFANILFLSDVYSQNKFKGGAELAFDFVKTFTSKVKGTANYNKIYQEFMEHGGAMDYLSVDGIKALDEYNSKNILIKGPKKLAQGVGRFLSYLGETSEISFRVAVYEKSKQNLIEQFKKDNAGKEPNKEQMEDIMFGASREARETIDFSQGGTSVKALDRGLPYLNAATQGFRKGFDYAVNNPKKFSISMIQAATMAGSFAAASMLMLFKGMDDEDDVLEILESVSDYEKSNYHIIFTGNKNKDGEFEYIRIKKLPFLGAVSALSEQLVIKAALKSKNIKYELSDESINKSLRNLSPVDPRPDAILQRNPGLSAYLTYIYNYDTFYDQEVFKGPRNKKIKPSAEGLYDSRVDQIYKDLGEATGLSPKRTKAAIEKIITSETTNPIIGLIYSGYDVFAKEDVDVSKEINQTFNRITQSISKKTKRFTNKNLIRYKEEAKLEEEEIRMETDVYSKEQKVYSEIRKKYKDEKGTFTNEEFINLIKENFEPRDYKKYAKKYLGYIRNMNSDPVILDIVYEETPEVQALLIFNKFGDSFDEEEREEIIKVFKASGRKFSKKALFIYNQKYKKKN